MSRKKTRIAKGIGASALAIATLASGLSFGAASATAATAVIDPGARAATGRAPIVEPSRPVSETYAKIYVKGGPGSSDAVPYRAVSGYRTVDQDLVYTHSGYANEYQAERAALSFSVPEYGYAQQVRQKGSSRCLGQSWTVVSCDAGDLNQRFYLAEDGMIRNLIAADRFLQLAVKNPLSNASEGFYAGKSGFALVDGPYVEAAKPQTKLEGAVEFGASADARATVKGTTEANGTVEVRRGSTVIGTDTADANGAYSVQIAAPNKAGDDKLTVTLVEGGADKKTIDVTASYGAGVVITDPADNADVMGGVSIRGTAQDGSTTTVKVGGAAAQTVPVSPTGQWSYDTLIPRGETKIVATSKSKGANTTTQTITLNPGEDGTELPAPTARIAFPDNVERRATATGTGAPGASITIFDGTRQVGNATVAANGTWGSELLAVSNGIHTLTIKQTLGDDQNEITADADYGTELTVNTPAAVQDTTEVTLTGTGTPNAKISLRDNTGTTRSTTVRTDGTWSLAGNFRPDTTSVTVVSLSKGAVMVRKDATIDVNITTRPITVTSPSQEDAANDSITDGNISFTGTATPFSTVQFATWPDGIGRVVFTTYADANGNWSATGWLAKSYYKLSGVQYAIGGDVTKYNMFPFSTVGFQALDVAGPTEGDVVIGGQNTFTGTATPGATVEVRRADNGTVIARGTAEGFPGTWNAKAVLNTGTTYDLEVVQTALNGKTDTVDIGAITPVASQGIDELAFTHNGNMNDGSNITFTFLAQPGATVSVWTGAKDDAGADKPWIREMASGTADKYGHVKISGYAAANNLYNLKVYAGTEVKDWTITTTPSK